MDIRAALKRQYRAGLRMLRQAVEVCPAELWVSGHHPRNYWRIAYHGVFYCDLYLQPTADAFVRWEKDQDTSAALWGEPPVLEPYSQVDILDYIDRVEAEVDAAVDLLDSDSPDSGFPWYPGMPKLDHQILNIRHLQGHVGQLSELLMANGIDTDWMSTWPRRGP